MRSRGIRSTKRRGLSDLDRYKVCIKRQDPWYAKMSYEEFGRLFPGSDGRPMAQSTVSDILKEKNKWLALDISGPVWKKKHRQEQYPILERHLREWVDRANEAAVNVTDNVLSTVGKKISKELSQIEGHIEDYTDFTFSHGWVTAFKCQYGMGRMKLKGDSGNYDEGLVLQHRAILQDRTGDFA